MAKSNNQKAKILYLEKLLYGTGENDTITMQEILAELQKHEIRAERKSIYDDFAVLREFGLDIRYRRGRDGGYYLAGAEGKMRDGEENADKPSVTAVKETAQQTPVQEKTTQDDSRANREGWMQKKGTASSQKQIKLLWRDNIREQVQLSFGKGAQYKKKENGCFMVTADYIEDPVFFGWLTAMGADAHIVKPKKAAQAYREYLKSLAREYKGL